MPSLTERGLLRILPLRSGEMSVALTMDRFARAIAAVLVLVLIKPWGSASTGGA